MLITTDGNIPSRYAHSFNVMKMAQGFYDAGEDVTVVSLFSLPNVIEYLKVKDVYKYYGISKNIKLKFLPVLNKDFFRRVAGAKEFNLKTAKFIKNQNPNFVYCRSYLTTFLTVREGIPSMLETHTTNYDCPGLQKVYKVASNPNFLGLVTIHKNIKNEHIKRGMPEEKILVVEDGVDLSLFDINDDRYYWRKKLRLPTDINLVVYCGQLYEEKGIEHTLLSAKKLSGRKILFVLVGGFSKDIKKWKRYCKRMFINNVVFVGFVNNLDVPKYLKSGDVLIMPYKTNMPSDLIDINTTSPLKLFEYMASNRPIISTNISAISKVIEHNKTGMLAEPNHIEQLSLYVLELLKDRKKAEELASNAFEGVKKYTWVNRSKAIISKWI